MFKIENIMLLGVSRSDYDFNGKKGTSTKALFSLGTDIFNVRITNDEVYEDVKDLQTQKGNATFKLTAFNQKPQLELVGFDY